MSGYLLYTPHQGQPPALRGLVREQDLPLQEAPLHCAGPDGNTGSLWYFPDHARGVPHLVYDADRQVWQKLPQDDVTAPDVWIGWPEDAPPEPNSLMRTNDAWIPGSVIALGPENHEWIIPNAIAIRALIIPQTPPEERLWLIDRFSRTIDAKNALFEFVHSSKVISDEWAIEYAGEMLAMNYRVTADILVLTGLLTADDLMCCLRGSTDTEQLDALLTAREAPNASAPERDPAPA